MTQDEFVAEVEWQYKFNVHTTVQLRAFGLSRDAFVMRLRRANRLDLAMRAERDTELEHWAKHGAAENAARRAKNAMKKELVAA